MLSAIISLNKNTRIEYTDKPFHHVNITSPSSECRVSIIPGDVDKMAELGNALLAAAQGKKAQQEADNDTSK